jgi:hypothetical protein
VESTLSLKKADYMAKVGHFLGYGRGSDYGETAWTDQQEADINDCVESGLRQFYFPEPMNGISYTWNFLKPFFKLKLDEDAEFVELPDDFGGFEGPITVSTSSSTQYRQLTLTNDVRKYHASSASSTGPPCYAAVEPMKGTLSQSGQRFQLHVYPTAEQEYILEGRYMILANALDGTRPYAYGGMPHAETILESCLAIAEQRHDDLMNGGHTQKYLTRLAASIAHDQRLGPRSYGRNTDTHNYGDRRQRSWEDPIVTFDGVAYE